MSRIIEELKKEHEDFSALLKDIKKSGVISKEGQENLLKMKEVLIPHIQKEDTNIYPVLRNAAKSNKKIQEILDLFAKDMAGITKEVDVFFNKYTGSETDIGFAKDFGHIAGLYRDRMIKEENILFREFEKLQK